MANKAYKYRIYPNKKQQELFNKTFGCVRFIYNNLLADRKAYYKTNKEMLKREVTYYKNQEMFSFLKEVDSLALVNAKINLDTAYKKFFTKEAGFPKFHKKGEGDSYTTNYVNGNICICDKKIKLPKVGFVKIKQHRLIGDNETIKNCTISKKANKYYISICVSYSNDTNSMDKKLISKD